MYMDEIKKLKDYMNDLSKENDMLKKEQRERQIIDIASGSYDPSSDPSMRLSARLWDQNPDIEIYKKGLQQKEKMIDVLQ